MHVRFTLSLVALALAAISASAQGTVPQAAPTDPRLEVYAVTNATVYTRPGQRVENATLIVRQGKVERVGTDVTIPAEAVVYDVEGKTIVPGFIDLVSYYGQPEVDEGERDYMRPQYGSNTRGAYSWNEALKSEYQAAANFSVDAEAAEGYRALGYSTVLSHRPDGISRGSAAVVSLAGDRPERELLLAPLAAHVLSFSKGSSAQMYPGSLMGMIALLRQTYIDADWYADSGQTEETNLSLRGWNDLQQLPQLFVVGDKLEAMRARRLGTEFDEDYIIVGAGDEYQRMDGFSDSVKFVLPLTFPDAYDVEDPYDAQQLDYADMLHWELADQNPARLRRAGHQIALTVAGLDDKDKKLFERLERVHAAGLSAAELLKALTLTPARYLGLEGEIGTLEPGRIANFVVLDEWPVKKDSKVYQTWVQGRPDARAPLTAEVPPGKYRVAVGDSAVYSLDVAGENKAKVATGADTTQRDAKLALSEERITLSFPVDTGEAAERVRLAGRLRADSTWAGQGYDTRGSWVSWTARPAPEGPDSAPDSTAGSAAQDSLTAGTDSLTAPYYADLPRPFGAFGTLVLPEGEDFVVRGATVWTNEEAGILEAADVYVAGGKIAAVGAALIVPAGVVELDGAGKHLTTGIIDEHSHIAIDRGVNEASQESTAEVRVGDVIDSEDVNLYRHLAGGVTALQQLHGSANPIGGQSALIKLRWGMLPEALKIDAADGYIKFALGENVKQSNWGTPFTTRYPQTRMGVEQVYDDYFTRAAEYDARRKAGDATQRRDLDLEALAEILNSERFITCHSYRQSEINMLMKVAERHDFRVNTFTHILEGYKVADKMAEHGAGASTFSDWWAYKYEVWDAIPYNGAIMHDNGVLVAFNSDDAELGRRLNQEAGKAVQFGDVPEEEAWKFVTLNPAKLLHLDNRMGSMRVGKDADLVLWNAHPMSVYAMAEKTWVDGTLYFDRAEMRERQARARRERNRLAQAMLTDKKAGKPVRPMEAKAGEQWHCDAITTH